MARGTVAVWTVAVMLAAPVGLGALAAAFDPTQPGDALADPNNGGLTDLDDFSTRQDIWLFDSDYGGIPDRWELLHGFDPRDPADDVADSDGDGWTNAVEFTRQTDPRDPDTDGDGIPDGLDPNPLYPDCDWSGDNACGYAWGDESEGPTRMGGTHGGASSTPGQGGGPPPTNGEPSDVDGDGIEE
jgi:hypothetical protein